MIHGDTSSAQSALVDQDEAGIKIYPLRWVTDTHHRLLKCALSNSVQQVFVNFVSGLCVTENISELERNQKLNAYFSEVVFAPDDSAPDKAASEALHFIDDAHVLCGLIKKPRLPYGPIPDPSFDFPDWMSQWTPQGLQWLTNVLGCSEAAHHKGVSVQTMVSEFSAALLEALAMQLAEQFSVKSPFSDVSSALALSWLPLSDCLKNEAILNQARHASSSLNASQVTSCNDLKMHLNWKILVKLDSVEVPIILGRTGVHFLDVQNTVYGMHVSEEHIAEHQANKQIQNNFPGMSELSTLNADFWHGGCIRLELFLGETEVRIDEVLNLSVGDVLMLKHFNHEAISLRTTRSLVEVAKVKLMSSENNTDELTIQVVSKTQHN